MSILDDTRSDWHARSPLRPLTIVPWSARVGVSWHYIGPGRGPGASGPHSACLEQVRDWQAQHQAKNWKDIGYNALVCQHARAIEGRGLTAEGSHSPGVNTGHVGIQFMVGTLTTPPSPAMLERAVQLRADIGALGHNIRRDWGHRDDPAASTDCPGDEIEDWVRTGGPTTKEDDMPTPREISADVLGWDTVPAGSIPFDPPRKLMDLRTATAYAARWALEARDAAVEEAARTRALLDALALKLLTEDEIAEAARAGAAAALDARITSARVELVAGEAPGAAGEVTP